MKKILLAVAVLLVLWIVAETNMGAIHRLVYGDIAPPDIPYTGGAIEGYNIVFDEVVRPRSTPEGAENRCSVGCKWLLRDTPFNKVYLAAVDGAFMKVRNNDSATVAVLSVPCEEDSLSECITTYPVDQVPKRNNTLIYREYYVFISFAFANLQYSGYEFCIGERVVARYSQVKWLSKTELAKIFQVGHGSLGRDVTGSSIDAGDRMDALFSIVDKVATPTKGSMLCPRNSIGL